MRSQAFHALDLQVAQEPELIPRHVCAHRANLVAHASFQVAITMTTGLTNILIAIVPART